MAAGNLYALQNFFNVNWSAKWCTKPTFKAQELMKEDEAGDYLYYGGGKPVETPVGNGWVDRKETFKFLLRSTTQGNVELMFEELKYMVANLFYPAPFTPVSHESEVLAYYDCNYTGDGAGDHCHDHQTTYDLTFGAGAAAPAWVTTGALNRKNYIHLHLASITVYMSHDTLLDTAPAALSIETIMRVVTNAAGLGWIIKQNAAGDIVKLYADTTVKPVYYKKNGGAAISLTTGLIPLNKWVSVLMTAGARGMEFYLNGILIAYNTDTAVMGNGTNADFLVESLSSQDAWDISILRISNQQRLPWDPKGLTLALKDVQHGPGYYEAECEIVGMLSNIYVGGNL